MIPKIIHYCWFGGKSLNKLGKKCVKSWKKFFPDYEIIQWDESNFDINSCRYVKEAYEAKKWAFVSDYARFKILYEHGGIYFDTDVEVIKSFDDILSQGGFMGCENFDLSRGISVAPGLGMASESGNEFYKMMLNDYEKSSFYNSDGSLNLYTVVQRATDLLLSQGLKQVEGIQKIMGINIFPAEYFCPINMGTGKLEKTEKTYSIHRYQASWVSKGERLRGRIYFFINKVFGVKIARFARKLFGRKNGKV